MTLATLPRPNRLGSSPERAEGWGMREVGPGWEVLLMPAPLGRLVTDALRRSAAASAVGWIFAHAGHWGILLPERSDDPAWPPGTTYLKTGGPVTLPPSPRHVAFCDSTPRWVRRDGDLLSRPLLLHPVVTLLATSAACSPARTGDLTMPTAGCPTTPDRATAPAGAHAQHRAPRDDGPALAEVLDLQEADVPHTAEAFRHFFGDL
ncbi:hypothetical protein [Streptomyces murinus]|uniref:hypothetical protein n=1 Tax=Streptomyces murinus TaxID=33900 RepID=UPI0036E15354